MSALDLYPYDYQTPLVTDPERPRYGLTWPHLQTLQYRASLLEVRTHIRCRVVQVWEHNPIDDSEREVQRPKPEETFEIATEHANAGPLEYTAAMVWLDAFEEGVREYQWVCSDPQNRQ